MARSREKAMAFRNTLFENTIFLTRFTNIDDRVADLPVIRGARYGGRRLLQFRSAVAIRLFDTCGDLLRARRL
jgi:hypothetical protein